MTKVQQPYPALRKAAASGSPSSPPTAGAAAPSSAFAERLTHAHAALDQVRASQAAAIASESFVEQKTTAAQQQRTLAAQQGSNNPFAPVSEAELQAVMADVMQNDPRSMSMMLLRLQARVQRQQLHFEFESNTSKSDHDDKKLVLSNLR